MVAVPRKSLSVGAALLLLALPAMGAGGDSSEAYYQEAARDPGRLMLLVGDADPTHHLPRLGEAVRPASLPDAAGRRYSLVQFDGPLSQAEVAQIQGKGVELLDYVPNNAWIVRTKAPGLTLSSLPRHRWSGDLLAGYKMDLPILARAEELATPDKTLDVLISVWRGEDVEALSAELKALGVQVLDVPKSLYNVRLLARLPESALPGVARLGAVRWMESRPQIEHRNNSCTGVIQSGVDGNRSIWSHGLHGEGQVIGHIDGGIALNSCYFLDPGVPTPGPTHRKLVGYRDNHGVDSHGTHTAGTIAGQNSSGDTNNAGHAYMARISHANDLDVTGQPDTGSSNLDVFLQNAATDGACVHTNSWGDDTTTAYTSLCEDIDAFSWNNEDQLVIFAETNTTLLKTPENAKNVLAVGDALHAPNFNSANTCGVGPTRDGRRKPEIFAPGTSTVSAGTVVCGTASMTGTSMASPAITGEAALVRQYYMNGFYPSGIATPTDAFTPSGALVKATLLNGSVDMTNIAGYPSNQEGWGRLVLDNPLYFNGESRKLQIIDARRSQGKGLGTGQVREYAYTVTDATVPLKATLVWMDPPVARNTTLAPVNNLDLEVVAPDTSLYKGNIYASGQSVTGGSADALNDVEMFETPSPSLGTYVFRVKATTVNEAFGQQGFALVVSGAGLTTARASVTADAVAYRCGTNVGVTVVDSNNIWMSTSVAMTTPAGDSETLTVTAVGAGPYTGSIPLSSAHPLPGNGVIEGDSGTTISLAYHDSDTGGGVAADITNTTLIDCLAPEVTNPTVSGVGWDRVTFTFNASEPSSGQVQVLQGGTPAGSVPLGARGGTSYGATLTGLVENTAYVVKGTAVDAVGNVQQVDNGGPGYSFVTLLRVLAYAEDFEPGDGGYTPDTPTGGPGAAWFYKTDDTMPHLGSGYWYCVDAPVNQDASLVTPPLVLAANVGYLSFFHTYEFEFSQNVGWDGGVLEYTTNGGSSWVDAGALMTMGGYSGTIYQSGSNPLIGRNAFISGTPGTMTEVRVDLTSLAGSTVQFRWRVGADDNNGDLVPKGWAVDDIKIYNLVQSQPIPEGWVIK